jgi:putative transposase
VINRGNSRNEVFKSSEDDEEFIDLLKLSLENVNLSLYTFCLMPNHFYILLRANKAADMSEWMRWLMTSHVRRYHKRNQTSGHLWQGRYKYFPV